MAVKMAERCEFVDPITGKQCGRRATYFGDGQFCEGNGHDPAPIEDEQETEMTTEMTTEATTTEQPTTTVKAKKAKPEPRQCECGCGELTGGGRFRPGHDAVLKGRLLKMSRAGDAAATAELEERGWLNTAHENAAERDAEQAKRRAERLAEQLARIDTQIEALQAKRAEVAAQVEAAS